jgi:hypothetical protein
MVMRKSSTDHIFKDVDEPVATLDFGTISPHAELVNTRILGPVGTNPNVALKNLALGLLLEEAFKVILDESVVGTRRVRNSREQDGILGVSVIGWQQHLSQEKRGRHSKGGTSCVPALW